MKFSRIWRLGTPRVTTPNVLLTVIIDIAVGILVTALILTQPRLLSVRLKLNRLETISAATAREADRLDVIDSYQRGESHHEIQMSLP